METFTKLKFHLRRLGILKWNDSLRAKSVAIATNCIVLGLCITFALITGSFVIFKAETQLEISLGLFFSFSAIFFIFWFILSLWNKNEIELLLVDLDAIIQKRKKISAFYPITYEKK